MLIDKTKPKSTFSISSQERADRSQELATEVAKRFPAEPIGPRIPTPQQVDCFIESLPPLERIVEDVVAYRIMTEYKLDHMTARQLAKQSHDRNKVTEYMNQHGIALFLAMLALMLVTGIGLAMTMQANLETMTSTNWTDARLAHNVAHDGLEEVRDRMRTDLASALPTAKPTDHDGVLYVVNGSITGGANPWTAGAPFSDWEICREINCPGGTGYPHGSGYQLASASTNYMVNHSIPDRWAWVRIQLQTNWRGINATKSDDYVCWDSVHGHEVVQANICGAAGLQPVYLITSMSLTARGSSETQQSEVISQSPANPFAALTLIEGASCYTAPGNQSCPTIFGAAPTAANALPNVAQTIIDGVGGPAIGDFDTSDNSTLTPYFGAKAVGGVQDIAGAISSFKTSGGTLDSVSGLDGLVSDVAAIPACTNGIYTGCAQNFLPGAADCSHAVWGTDTAPSIVLASQCDFSGNASGILVTTGQLNFRGGTFHGLVITIGSGDCMQPVNTEFHLVGAWVCAQTHDRFDGSLLSGPGVPRFQWADTHSTASNPSIKYDAAAVQQALISIYPVWYKELNRRMVMR